MVAVEKEEDERQMRDMIEEEMESLRGGKVRILVREEGEEGTE